MPKNAEGYRQLGTWQPVPLVEQLEALAAANRRTIEEELRHALERHLATPPVVRYSIQTPDLPPAPVEPTKQGRGRKKRGTT